ncbi:MAG TPA: site-2 protease family protein [Chloroflexia bacterium]|nr:site-2 protease family protein [Chloroflexia bacterium]
MGSFSTAVFLGALLAYLIGTPLSKGIQAIVAYRLGDRLPRSEGRMTFKLSRQVEPLGLLLALFLSLGIGVATWGKPLNLNPFANRLKRLGSTVIALSGVLTYIVLGVVVGLILKAVVNPANVSNVFINTAFAFVYFSFLLAAFNVIPIPPLDGYNLWKGLFPASWDVKLVWLETYGAVILLVLTLFIPFFIRINLLFQFVFNPIVQLLLNLIGLGSQPVI